MNSIFFIIVRSLNAIESLKQHRFDDFPFELIHLQPIQGKISFDVYMCMLLNISFGAKFQHSNKT